MGGRIADKIPWCKFWHSCLSDPSLEELELHQWARWARLIIFVRGHGDNGKLHLEPPARALQNVLRVRSYEELIATIRLFKNVSLAVTDKDTLRNTITEPLRSYFMNVRNWYKYQGDDSKERVRKWRVTKSVTKSVKSNALEKSRVDLTSTSTSSATNPRALRRASSSQEHREETVDEMPIKDTRAEWEKPIPDKIKSYEEAGDNELCGPPKDMLKQIKALTKKVIPGTD